MFDIDKTTTELENNGVWVTFREGKFLIAHTNNMVFQRTFTRLQAPHRKRLEKGTLDPKIQLDTMCKAMAKGILLDWKNVSSKGKKYPYSEEAAYALLLHNSELREFVQDTALDLENYRSEEIEELGES